MICDLTNLNCHQILHPKFLSVNLFNMYFIDFNIDPIVFMSSSVKYHEMSFDIFKGNLLSSHQAYSYDNSNSIVSINVFISLPLRKTLVSSAKST